MSDRFHHDEPDHMASADVLLSLLDKLDAERIKEACMHLARRRATWHDHTLRSVGDIAAGLMISGAKADGDGVSLRLPDVEDADYDGMLMQIAVRFEDLGCRLSFAGRDGEAAQAEKVSRQLHNIRKRLEDDDEAQ